MPSVLLILLALPPAYLVLHVVTWLSMPAAPASLRNKRILLLTAHPDDEAMFFSPTLLALTDPRLGNRVKILCLSTGDADGLGETRSRELRTAAATLGVQRESDVFVLDDKVRFRDGMAEVWRPDDVARTLATAFLSTSLTTAATRNNNDSARSRKSKPASSSSSPAPGATAEATIDILLTFDAYGVSRHPNHRALHAGARLFLAHYLMRGRAGWACPVALYTLTSVNVVRKYAGVLDALPTLFLGALANLSTPSSRRRGAGASLSAAIFVNGPAAYWTAREAMVHGHVSQMLWFRWGWVTFGRYMVVNDLRRERVVASSLSAAAAGGS